MVGVPERSRGIGAVPLLHREWAQVEGGACGHDVEGSVTQRGAVSRAIGRIDGDGDANFEQLLLGNLREFHAKRVGAECQEGEVTQRRAVRLNELTVVNGVTGVLKDLDGRIYVTFANPELVHIVLIRINAADLLAGHVNRGTHLRDVRSVLCNRSLAHTPQVERGGDRRPERRVAHHIASGLHTEMEVGEGGAGLDRHLRQRFRLLLRVNGRDGVHEVNLVVLQRRHLFALAGDEASRYRLQVRSLAVPVRIRHHRHGNSIGVLLDHVRAAGELWDVLPEAFVEARGKIAVLLSDVRGEEVVEESLPVREGLRVFHRYDLAVFGRLDLGNI